MRPAIRFFLGALAAPFLLSLIAPLAAAQIQFSARLDEGQVVPATGSAAVGRAWFHLEPTTQQLWYRVETDVPGANGGWIATAPAGFNGPPLILLGGGGPSFQGVTPPLTPAQVDDLFLRNLYVTVRNAAFPGGVIRGQIWKSRRRSFTAALDGVQSGTGSPGTGTANVELLLPERVAIYRVDAAGLMAPPFGGAELHQGAPGAFGPLVGILDQMPGALLWGGVTPTLDAAVTLDMLAGDTYVGIQTPAFGVVEIRGQLEEAPERFVLRGDGAQFVPPSASPNTMFGTFTFNPTTNVLNYNVNWSGVAVPIPPQLRIGPPNQPGAIVGNLVGPPVGPWVGAIALAPNAVEALFTATLHVDLFSFAFPAGDARGIVLPNPDAYGYSGPTAAGALDRVLRIGQDSTPFVGNPSFGVTLHGAFPGAACGLGFGPDRAGTPLDLGFIGMPNHVLWANPLLGVTVVADPLGRANVNIAIPALPAFIGEDFFFQWVSIEPPANPAGIVTSDGLLAVVIG